jgi:hypothetical protein
VAALLAEVERALGRARSRPAAEGTQEKVTDKFKPTTDR